MSGPAEPRPALPPPLPHRLVKAERARRAGLVAGLLALLAGSTFLVAADIRPAKAQFGISIGGFGMGGGGYRARRPSMAVPGRSPGRFDSMSAPRGGRFDRTGPIGRGGRFGPSGERSGRFVDGPMERGGRFGPSGERPGRFGRWGDEAAPGRRPDGRPPWTRPGRRPGGDDVAGRPPETRPPGTRPPGRHPPARPPGRRPPVFLPDGGPIVMVPPRGPIGPGGPPRLPPGGGMPPPRGPNFGPPAALAGVPALVSAARAGTDRAQDLPGLPAANERRYVPDEVIFVLSANAPAGTLRNVARRFGLTPVASEASALVGSTVHRYRIPNRTTVPAAIRAMSRARGVGYVQPNYLFQRPDYVFRLQSASTTPGGGASLQYVVDALRLPEAHRMARGEQVPIAVIDSGVETAHPEVAGRIAKTFDAVGGAFRPHEHGTGMAGAIVAHGQLTGVSPRANILAARAFAPGQASGATGTSFHILKAMDWSIREGARVINMSFAGPRDPMMTRAIQVAAGRRIALVAAMGNEGPDAPASFPAADPNVIAVTATDQSGHLFASASRGDHVAVAAPGVEVILPAPNGGYQISSGTSVAAAHVSGIAALLLERQPDLGPDDLRRILKDTARRGPTPDPLLGAGLADPVPALNAAARGEEPGVPMVTAPAMPAPETAEAPPTAGSGPDTAQAGAPPAAPRQATVDPGKAGD